MSSLEDLKSNVSKSDARIHVSDLLESLGKAAVLRERIVNPFYFELSIADSASTKVNFPELQNLELVEFAIESNGALAVSSNIFRLLAGSQTQTLNGKFGLAVPDGRIFIMDFVPKFNITNSSGSTRLFAFFGWTSPIERRKRSF